ncbi:hypothetical protein MNBD_GAMMA11-1796 [hydrothermal vent metagenome]|uniref:Uncharacterized protein n=1 Tax=hydrothermal vent metagenome TaxID=652676 RepID=A0A3B0XRH5_9ZZZZ
MNEAYQLIWTIYLGQLTNKPERKDTRNLKASAAGMRMPSLQGGIYGDFSIVGILSTRFSSIWTGSITIDDLKIRTLTHTNIGASCYFSFMKKILRF